MKRAEWKVLILALVLAFVTFALGALFFQVLRDAKPRTLADLWYQWDTHHYLFIAEHGYPASGGREQVMVFFPLYPWLTRAVMTLIGYPLASALLISNVCGTVSAVLMFRLANLDRHERVAYRAAVALLIFPTAYFLHVGYSESLFLMLTLGSFLRARRGDWAGASVLACLGVLTRLVGLALLPALCVEYWHQRKSAVDAPSSRIAGGIAWLSLIPAGFLVYLGLNAYVHGDPLRFLEFQRVHWHKEPGSIVSGLLGAWNISMRSAPSHAAMSGGFELAAGALGLIGGAAATLRLRPSYGAYMLVSWIMITTSSFWQSTPRYLLVLFPIYLVLADMTREPTTRVSLAFLSVALHTFFLSRFVVGAWVF